MQIFNTNSRTWRTQVRTREEMTALVEGLRRHRLPLFLHSIYLINLASADPLLRERSVSALADALVMGAMLGAAGVVTHIGSRHHQSFPDAARLVVSSIAEVIHLADVRLADVRLAAAAATADGLAPTQTGCADSPVPALLLESAAGSGTTLGGRLDELAAIGHAAHRPCGICLDTAHLFAAGYPLHTAAGLDDLVAELRRLGLLDQVRLIHLNDSRTAVGSSSDRHDNLGDGQIGFDGLGRVVRHPAFRKVPFVLEVPGLEKAGPDAVNLARAKSMRQGPAVPPARPARPA
ncbi:MAG: TIM barrel protein [Chloroflexi bacterium]|nr:TIM barrel protein [Chloroflexota bacterium]